MANTASAKKAIRSSSKKKEHNLFWKRRIASAEKNLVNIIKDGGNADIIIKELSVLQKILDKAVKEQIIHRNKANRVKSNYAKKITANGSKPIKESKPARKSKASTNKKS
ncbi:30S ribosomal protein S20 [candidate division WWE3 bacterium]|nr:30S ribosomal protein S20 [candidate division WWE3 bacterium]